MTSGPAAESEVVRSQRDQLRTLNLTSVIILGVIVLKGSDLLQLKQNLNSPLLPSYLWEDLARPLLIELTILAIGLFAGLLFRWKGNTALALGFHIAAIVLAMLRYFFE